MGSDVEKLIERIGKSREADNALDMEIDITLFRPDQGWESVRPNAAGTKLIYRRRDGSEETVWSRDHTLNGDSRREAIALLRALQATEAHQ